MNGRKTVRWMAGLALLLLGTGQTQTARANIRTTWVAAIIEFRSGFNPTDAVGRSLGYTRLPPANSNPPYASINLNNTLFLRRWHFNRTRDVGGFAAGGTALRVIEPTPTSYVFYVPPTTYLTQRRFSCIPDSRPARLHIHWDAYFTLDAGGLPAHTDVWTFPMVGRNTSGVGSYSEIKFQLHYAYRDLNGANQVELGAVSDGFRDPIPSDAFFRRLRAVKRLPAIPGNKKFIIWGDIYFETRGCPGPIGIEEAGSHFGAQGGPPPAQDGSITQGPEDRDIFMEMDPPLFNFPADSTSEIGKDADAAGVERLLPHLSPIGKKTGQVGVPLTVNASASDPDGNSFTYALLDQADNVLATSTTGSLTWTPTTSGVLPYKVRASRAAPLDFLTDEQQITLVIGTGSDHPPTFNDSVIPDKVASVGQPLTFTLGAASPDGRPLTFSLGNDAPAGAGIDTLNPTTGSFHWTPTPDQGPGDYVITVRVTDNGSLGLLDERQFNVRVDSAVPADAPAGVSATAQPGCVMVTWSTVANATEYALYRSTTPGDDGEVILESPTTTGLLDKDVTVGTTYYYRIAAVNNAGVGPLSPQVSATPFTPATRISVQNVSGMPGQTISLSATLSRMFDSSGLAGRTLRFSINGTPVGTAITLESGTATLSYLVNDGLTGGGNLLTVDFAGDSGDCAYSPSTGTGTLTVVPADTTLAGGTAAGAPGQTVSLGATLRRTTDNRALINKPVAFQINGNFLGMAATDGSGVAAVSYVVPDTLGGGPFSFLASFGGDALYNGTTGTGTLTITAATTVISVSSVTGAQGQTVPLMATLVRQTDGAGVTGRSLTFAVDGVPVATATTGPGGVASTFYTIPGGLALGAHSLTAAFAGEAVYAASSGMATLTVTPGGGNVLVDQQPDGSLCVISQDLPDMPAFTTYSFDDFSLPSSARITDVTIYGIENGNAGANRGVWLAFPTGESAMDLMMTPKYPGFEDPATGQLHFVGLNVPLGPGTHYLCAWVQRAFSEGGQWFWCPTRVITGSYAMFHNPGGGFGLGTAPQSLRAILGFDADLSFTLYGTTP